MGSQDEFWHLWQHSEQPDRTTGAVLYAAESLTTLSMIAHHLLGQQMLMPLHRVPFNLSERLFSPELSTRRSIFQALVCTPLWSGLDRKLRDELLAQIRQLVIHESDPGMQAQAIWVVRAMTPPELRDGKPWFSSKELKAVSEGRPWSINSLGIEMIHIDGAESVGHDYMLSQFEIDAKTFESFVITSGYEWPAETLPVDRNADYWTQKPQNFISWYDCAAFCNWLSRRENLEECYLPNADGKYAQGMSVVPDVVNRNGYRLPLSIEWQVACRAGAKTRFACGDLEGYQTYFAWTGANINALVPNGQKQPNALGFFDMHGNVCEWILDDPNTHDLPGKIDDSVQRFSCGGHYQSDPADTAWDRSTCTSPQRAQPR